MIAKFFFPPKIGISWEKNKENCPFTGISWDLR
jgi:hypothetical protein